MDPTFSPDEAKWHPPAPTQQHNGGRAIDGHSGQRGRRGWGMTHHSNRYLGPGGRHLSPTLHSVIQKKGQKSQFQPSFSWGLSLVGKAF